MAWGAGARLEGLAHGEALAFTIVRVVEHDPERRRALGGSGRQDLCGNQISGAPRHRRDVVSNLTHWLISTQTRTAARRRSRRREDDLASSLVGAKCTKPRRHGRLRLLVLGEGNEAKPSRLALRV